ncbi:hypothetical protein Tco_1250015 [Tanacetum coccineum]
MLKKPLRKLLYDQGNLHENVKCLRNEMDEVQRALDLDPSNSILSEEEAMYLQAFNDAIIVKECFLKQKAKIEWLRVRDSNTSYFHKMVKSRVERSRIDIVNDADGVTSNFNTIGLFPNTLSNEIATRMIRPVTNQEVKEAMFSMGDDKSPGPDRYTVAFFKEA